MSRFRLQGQQPKSSPPSPKSPPPANQGDADIPRPAKRCNLLSMSWVYPGAYLWWDVPKTPHPRGILAKYYGGAKHGPFRTNMVQTWCSLWTNYGLDRSPITEHYSGSGGRSHVAFWAAPGQAQWAKAQPAAALCQAASQGCLLGGAPVTIHWAGYTGPSNKK